MADLLTQLLEKRGFLLADGATGTNLFNMGLQSGDAPEFWNVIEQDKVRALYTGPVEAGSDLFLTNTFGANASRLALHDGQSRVRELNRAGAELAREVADKADRKVIVAGSVGPTGDIMEPMGPLTFDSAVEMFHEQAEGLKEGGADILWVETIFASDEYRAAAKAATLAGMPWCGTMSFDTAGRTMMGLTSAGMVDLVENLKTDKPVGFGANCGRGASDLLRTVLGFAERYDERGAEQHRPLIAKGNAGIPRFQAGHIHYDGTPELMADYAVLARDCGAKIIGGCCGTTPEHLRMMRAALDSTPIGPRPTLDDITSRLGAFSSEGDGTGEAVAPTRERRRRRG